MRRRSEPGSRSGRDDRPARPPWAVAVVAAVIACWVAATVVPPFALLAWRERRLAEAASPAAQEHWDTFRADMRRQTGVAGPVQRKEPKSPEPPELVWLRDYVHLAIGAWVALVGVLGGFFTAVAVGLTRSPSAAEDRPAGRGHHEKQHERDSEHADEG